MYINILIQTVEYTIYIILMQSHIFMVLFIYFGKPLQYYISVFMIASAILHLTFH